MVKALLIDIEGTTSSTHFVKEILFPYAAQQLPAYLRNNPNNPQVKAAINEIATLASINANDVESIIQQLLEWIKNDKKITVLKTLQGLIWEEGYRKGDYKAHVYPDAYDHLKKWQQDNIPLYLYSSGSIKAQQLFFKFSDYGDIRYLFQNYFDTTSGHKKESTSYHNIAKALQRPCEEILFLSDIVEELDAAKEAGMSTCWLVRKADTSATEEQLNNPPHPTAESFSQIQVSLD